MLMSYVLKKKTCRPAQKPYRWDSCEPTGQLLTLIAGAGFVNVGFFFQTTPFLLFYSLLKSNMSLKENFDPNLVTQPTWEPTIMHQNFSFHKKEAKYSIKFGWTCYYRSSKFRHPCSAVILHRHAAGTFEVANGIHTCAIGLVEKRKMDPVFINTTGIMDLTAEINIKIELLALTDMQPARLLAIQISEEFELLYAGQIIKSLSRDQIRKKIKRFRLEEFGNWQSVISSPPLCLATDTDERLFLQFNMSINIDEEMVRFVGWANPNLIFMAQFWILPTFSSIVLFI
jgi:hypothetical protein